MSDIQTSEAKSLREELESLNRQSKALNHRRNQIEASLLAIKWSEYPIGCRVKDSRGYEYEVGGYSNYWLLGYKIKKDGTRVANMMSIYGEVVKI